MPTFLTDLSIQKLPPGLHLDEKLPSFGIRVGQRHRTWIIIKGANRAKISLGRYPEVSLQDARKKAMAEFASPEVRRATITFLEAKDKFLALNRWRPQSKRVLISSLRHFQWSGPLARITPEQFLEVLETVEGRSAQAHALSAARTFFNWCVPRYLQASPAAGVKMERQRSRDRVLADEELAAVWQAAAALGYPFGNIVRLLILTGQRRSEIGHLQASSIQADRFYLPASVTKNGREHWVPLTPYMRTLLPAARGYLFPNALGQPFTAFDFNQKRLLKLSGTSGWTLHDLRRTFATGLARQATPIYVTEKILNHVSGSLAGVAGIYNRFDYWNERAAAVRAWEEHVLTLTGYGPRLQAPPQGD